MNERRERIREAARWNAEALVYGHGLCSLPPRRQVELLSEDVASLLDTITEDEIRRDSRAMSPLCYRAARVLATGYGLADDSPGARVEAALTILSDPR